MFDTVSSDDHYTGHKAATFGGTTTVMDFVVQNPASLSERGDRGEGGFRRAVDLWLEKAQKSAIDYSIHMNLTYFDEQVAKDIPSLAEMGITT